MPELVIIADDLTGAADCGIACAAAGLETLVVLGETGASHDAEVLSVDADTRGRSEADAVAETARLTHLHAAPGRRVFRKLDSTLRGHVGAELAAMHAARAADGAPGTIILAPAFPATKRFTVGGHQLLDGTPLEHTEIWQREGIPHTAHIPSMLARAGLRTAHLTLDALRGGDATAALAALAATHDAVVCDAESEADLRAIAAASAPLGPNTIWAGSAGLARHLPAAIGIGHAAPAPSVAPADGPILFVVGSVSRVSRAQVARLQQDSEIELVTVPPAVLRAGPAHPDWLAQNQALDAAIGSGRDVIALLGAEANVDLAEGLALCHALAEMVAPHAQRIGALVSTGGETARAVLLAFGTGGLKLMGEVEPGVPLSVTEGPRALPVVTKAGAFGTPDTLAQCRATLRAGFPTASLSSSLEMHGS